MYLCYLDESGTAETGGNTGHFVLLGVAIPAETWKAKDAAVVNVKGRYDLADSEIHTAWMARDYPEQRRVPDFEKLDYEMRRRAVLGVRAMNLARARTKAQQRDLLKNYKKTEDYVHLTRAERERCLRELADLVSTWGDARIFAEARDKTHAGVRNAFDVAFEQVVTRFNTFLGSAPRKLGLLAQDNNETVSRRLTLQMRQYHEEGTLWSNINNVVETPFFVDSQLTQMIQLADLGAYATRRYFEFGETDLFDRLYPRFDRAYGKLVGLRHFTGRNHVCKCKVCLDHGRRQN